MLTTYNVKNYLVYVCTEGTFTYDVTANTAREAIKIARDKWEEANFGCLEEPEIIETRFHHSYPLTFQIIFNMVGFHSYVIKVKENDSKENIARQMEEEWAKKDFGELENADVMYRRIVQA